MPRNALLERHRFATLALARGAQDVPIPSVAEGAVHELRRFCQCANCGGLGDPEQMIYAAAAYHPMCFRLALGIEAVLELPIKQCRKFRISDLSVTELRRLLVRVTRTPDSYAREAKKP